MSRSQALDRPPSEREANSKRSIREAHVTIQNTAFDAIGLEELLSIWNAAGLRNVETLAHHETGAVVQVTVDQPLNTDRLSAPDYIDQWTRVTNSGEMPRYVIEFTIPDFPPSLAERVADPIDISELNVTEHSITVSLVGSQETIATIVNAYEAAGLSPDLRKLGSFDGREEPLDTLTERQRDALETAYEMGYYEVPRAVSSQAIAAELDVDPSTVTEHLQRAERNLLSRHFSPDRSIVSQE